jgi:hypothetical protein
VKVRVWWRCEMGDVPKRRKRRWRGNRRRVRPEEFYRLPAAEPEGSVGEERSPLEEVRQIREEARELMRRGGGDPRVQVKAADLLLRAARLEHQMGGMDKGKKGAIAELVAYLDEAFPGLVR